MILIRKYIIGIICTITALGCSAIFSASYAQGSDVLLLKKGNGKTLQTITAGTYIVFKSTSGRYVEGTINHIKDDTLYINDFDVRRAYTIWGTSVLDTVSQFMLRFHYNEIASIVKERKGFEFVRNGTLFIIGGATFVALNLINSAVQKSSVNTTSLIISGAVLATGIVMKITRKNSYSIGGKYSFKYLDLTN
ncbi:hypothetical protein [Pollutibacter soli]|uniref:hypothetical protein n=1 Tax=Pollutibacter soli TaxID=3034157 RepID=UPI0030140BB2